MQPCQLTPTDTCTWFITHPAWKALARVSLNVGFKAVLASTLNDCFWPAATSRERLKSARSGRTTPTINPPFARETCVEAHSLSPALESIYEPIQRNALRSFLSPLSLLPSSSHQSCPPHAPDRSLLLRFLALPYSFAPPVRQSRPCRRGKATGGGHQRLPRPTAALRGAHGPSLDAAGSEVEPGLADRLWRRHAGDVEGFRLSGVSVRTIRLVGAEDAEEAFDMLQSRYCGALLDTQFADIGVHRDESEWQVVLARPLPDGHLDDPRAAGKT